MPPARRRVLACAAAALFPLLGASPAAAADQALIDAARKEGVVVWYSGLIVNQVVRPLSEGFQRKYPGIRVEGSRLTSGELSLKVLNELRAGRPQSDVWDGAAVVFRLKGANAVEPFRPSTAAAYPDRLKDPDGLWTALNIYVMTPAINTDLVPDAEAPKTLPDLLDPKWRGRIAWTNDLTISGPPGFIGTVLATMGQGPGMDYLRKLSAQKLVNVPASQRVVVDQVISGQYPIALMTFNNHSVISGREGAPVRWQPIGPATVLPNPVGLTRGAPHPNAGRLFLEYLLSDEGQQVFRAADYIPASPAVPARDPRLTPEAGGFQAEIFPQDVVAAKLADWVMIYNELFK